MDTNKISILGQRKLWNFSFIIILLFIGSCFVYNYFNNKTKSTIKFTSDKFEKLKSDFEKSKIVQFVYEFDVYVTIDLNENKIIATTTNGIIFKRSVKATKDLKTNIVQFEGEGNEIVYKLLTQMKGNNMYEILDSYFKINYLNNSTGEQYEDKSKAQYDKNNFTYILKNDKLTEIYGRGMNSGFYINNISY